VEKVNFRPFIIMDFGEGRYYNSPVRAIGEVTKVCLPLLSSDFIKTKTIT